MMISTKGRYALRVMVDLAEGDMDGYMPLKEIAANQGISLKYLESITGLLSKAHMVESASGKGGGYRLTKKASEYKVGDILRVVEGDLSPVTCLENEGSKCERRNLCYVLPFWIGLEKTINDYIDSHTLEDVIRMKNENID